MASRGSKKARSVEHEQYIADLYGGQRSKSSGAAETDEGDVRTKRQLIECKIKGGPKICKAHEHVDCPDCTTTPQIVSTMEKIADEAWSVGRNPAIALRYYAPFSNLASGKGYVDLVVRLVGDDAPPEDFCPEDGVRWR